MHPALTSNISNTIRHINPSRVEVILVETTDKRKCRLSTALLFRLLHQPHLQIMRMRMRSNRSLSSVCFGSSLTGKILCWFFKHSEERAFLYIPLSHLAGLHTAWLQFSTARLDRCGGNIISINKNARAFRPEKSRRFAQGGSSIHYWIRLGKGLVYHP